MSSKKRILCLDIEGGHGGSSRSLFQSLYHLDKTDFKISVWCRRKSEIIEEYRAIGIDAYHRPELPKISSLPKVSRNILQYFFFLIELIKFKFKFQKKIIKELKNHYDLIHFNHEGFFVLASLLKKKLEVPFTMHMRTMLVNNLFSRYQLKSIAYNINDLVFITENERDNFYKLSGVKKGSVIHNIAFLPQSNTPSLDLSLSKENLNIASLSNFALVRGVDRLIDLALVLKEKNIINIKFIVAGDININGAAKGELAKFKSLKDYAEFKEVERYFYFLGHVNNPEAVLDTCDLLIKLTREYNPWGRDIIEALAYGKPVVSIGQYNKFVDHNKTGLLYSEYNVEKIAEDLIDLSFQKEKIKNLGEAAKQRMLEHCHPKQCSKELKDIWLRLI